LPVVGSTWTTGLSAPGGLVDNDHKCEALRVRFTADGEADASEGGGGGGGGEVGGEPMIFYTITYSNIQNRIKQKRISHK